MGFLKALIASAGRYQDDLLPPGFSKGMIKWALDIDLASPANTKLVQIDVNNARVPDKPPDRTSSKLSAKLLTDKAEYVLGTLDAKKKRNRQGNNVITAHDEFIKMVTEAQKRLPALLSGIAEALTQIPKSLSATPKPTDQVAVRLNNLRLTDHPQVIALWAEMLELKGGAEVAICSVCGIERPVLRLFPGDLSLCYERGVKLMSVDTNRIVRDEQGLPDKMSSAFTSRGKLQLSNSPICVACASSALQVCRHLIDGHMEPGAGSGLNYAWLARSDAALQNQLAVFWTKLAPSGNPTGDIEDDDRPLSGPEPAARIVLGPQTLSDNGPPPEDAQMREVLRTPWTGKRASNLQTDAFYLAMLSPNKTRLVVREFMELGVEKVHGSISRYVAAARIIHPEGMGVWFPPLPALLDAMHPPKSDRSSEDGRRDNDPHLLRELLRCAFRDDPPPPALMAQAVRQFAIPARETSDQNQQRQQTLRRMNLASALKLCLTHDSTRMEQEAMEKLDDRRMKQPYLCGRLLATIGEAQRQYHWPNKVNTTLADRFYGTAATAPASVFANLIGIATRAHLPKLRREGRGIIQKIKDPQSGEDSYVTIGDKFEEICSALDKAGGFPPPLDSKGQAEFALGYYHQLAKFTASKNEAILEKKRKAAAKKHGESNV